MNKGAELIPMDRIQNCIFLIRGEKVMLDSHLAELYGVDTGTLNRAVKRNIERFPDDFVFQLAPQEVANLKCQIGISSSEHGGRRRSIPYVFTEQGVAMLSSVLRSKRAVQVNVAIMRAFVSLRRLLATNEALARKFAELEPARRPRPSHQIPVRCHPRIDVAACKTEAGNRLSRHWQRGCGGCQGPVQTQTHCKNGSRPELNVK